MMIYVQWNQGRGSCMPRLGENSLLNRMFEGNPGQPSFRGRAIQDSHHSEIPHMICADLLH